MRIVLCGDTHGHLDQMYEDAGRLRADVIVQLGDTGIWGSDDAVDAATKRHGYPRDYEKYLDGDAIAPVPTYFLKGNHENFDLLDDTLKNNGRIAENMQYVPNGSVLVLGKTRFGILGGNFSPAYFESRRLQGERRRHFLKSELELLAEHGFDILLSHDGPKSGVLDRGAQVLRDFIERTQPQANYHGHHHFSYSTVIGETKVVGLGRSHREGGMVVLDE